MSFNLQSKLIWLFCTLQYKSRSSNCLNLNSFIHWAFQKPKGKHFDFIWCNRCFTKIEGNLPNCTDEIKDLIATDNYCGAIQDSEGLFKSCVTAEDVDHTIAYTQCELDLCAVYNDTDLMKELSCNHVANFAQNCKNNGKSIAITWRGDLNCRAYVYHLCLSVCLSVSVCLSPI